MSGIRFGCLSDEATICLFASWSVLKRWKNSGNRLRKVVIWDMDRIDRLCKFLREDTRNGGVDLDMVNMRADESAF